MRTPLASPYRSYDAFAKPIEGIRTPTTTGGIITILATLTASLLLLSQLLLYIQVDTRHSLQLSKSHPLNVVIPTDGGALGKLLGTAKTARQKQRSKISPDVVRSLSVLEKNQLDLYIHVTFPNQNCKELVYFNNGQVESSDSYFRGVKFTKSPPTEYEYGVATQQNVQNLHKLSKKLPSRHINAHMACTIRGTMTIPKMEGDFGIRLNPTEWTQALELVSKQGRGLGGGSPMSFQRALEETGVKPTSLYIHEIRFGNSFSLVENPLVNLHYSIEDTTPSSSKTGLIALNIKLIPTHHKKPGRRSKETIQVSVSSYTIPAPILATTNPPKLPGVWMHYDVSPISVNHVESRENFLIFLSDVVSIVGGVFVTVGLVSACLVNSASAVAKKMD